MVKTGLLGVIISAFAISIEAARFDSEQAVHAVHTKQSVDLLKYAHQSNKYGNHRVTASVQRGSRAAVSVSATGNIAPASSNTAPTSDLSPMVRSFFECSDSKLLPGGCPTDASSKDTVCASPSNIVPGLSKAAFCPSACNSCEWYIQPRAATDIQTPYCLTGTQGGMQKCIHFSDDVDLKLRPREANGKIYFSIVSSINNFCFQDLSPSMKADKAIVKELTKLAEQQEETDEQTDLDKTLQDADRASIESFGPCILGKFEERQQWQLIPTGVPSRYLIRNRRTNKCLHFTPSGGAAPGEAPFTSYTTTECVSRMASKAALFYNQAVIIAPKPMRYTLQQASGSMRCVSAPALGASKPAASLNGADCLLPPDQGRHVFSLVPTGSCVNRQEPIVGAAHSGMLCPYQIQLSTGNGSSSSTKYCVVGVSSGSGSMSPSITTCASLPSAASAGVVPSFAEAQPALRQAWWLRETDANVNNKFQLRWMNDVEGVEYCLNYTPSSQGMAGTLTDCDKLTNPSDWIIRPYAPVEI